MLTTESMARIRESFALLSPQMDRVTENFYHRLFAARPEVRVLFRTDLKPQQQHLAAALALIVRNLTMLDALAGPFNQLGADHARAGVRPDHYPVVRDAMLAAMADALASTGAWTTQLADDWRQLLERIATHMLQGGMSRKTAQESSFRDCKQL